jgi:hypothetical protein
MSDTQEGLEEESLAKPTSGKLRRSKTCETPREESVDQPEAESLETSAERKRMEGRTGPLGVVRGKRAASRRLLMLGTVWKGGEGRGVVSLVVDMVSKIGGGVFLWKVGRIFRIWDFVSGSEVDS